MSLFILISASKTFNGWAARDCHGEPSGNISTNWLTCSCCYWLGERKPCVPCLIISLVWFSNIQFNPTTTEHFCMCLYVDSGRTLPTQSFIRTQSTALQISVSSSGIPLTTRLTFFDVLVQIQYTIFIRGMNNSELGYWCRCL